MSPWGELLVVVICVAALWLLWRMFTTVDVWAPKLWRRVRLWWAPTLCFGLGVRLAAHYEPSPSQLAAGYALILLAVGMAAFIWIRRLRS